MKGVIRRGLSTGKLATDCQASSPRFIDEFQRPRLERRLPVPPCLAARRHVEAVLLGRGRFFFDDQAQRSGVPPEGRQAVGQVELGLEFGESEVGLLGDGDADVVGVGGPAWRWAAGRWKPLLSTLWTECKSGFSTGSRRPPHQRPERSSIGALGDNKQTSRLDALTAVSRAFAD
jgi:hypothetical protein